MKSCNRIIVCLLTLLFVAGCASTKVSDRQQLVTGQLPRPDHILVYDFVATPEDVPGDSALSGQKSEPGKPQTAEQIATGKKVGAEIATKLVEQIRAMGMPAERAVAGSLPQINDIVLRGYLLSVDEGSAAKRVGIGFGSGGSELKVAVEGFQMTAQGLRKLGSGKSDAGGSKGPGGAVGLVTLLATHNPAGLIISGGMKVYGEASGKSKIEGRAEQTAKEIADILKKRFQEQGWVD
jgi:Domain of unknown function (DUF4410)